MIESFNTVSAGYDKHPLRFFSESARHMARYLLGRHVSHVLDVATGTGNLALEIARTFPDAEVTGIDFSPGMLARAREKADREGVVNARFLEMDMHEMTLPDGSFDAAVCAFGIFFAEDMKEQLQHITTKVRPGGTVVICCFSEDSFQPLVELLSDRLERYGIERPPLRWRLIATEETCLALLRDAGLVKLQVERKELGYFLRDSSEWWDVVWNAGFRRQVGQLSPEALEKFREEHLREIGALRTEDGIWLTVTVLYASGIRPAEQPAERPSQPS
jgi:ubiquinone/menaquinone biosynthesis C-methylase UbiE